jgi:hypothetical protein
MTTLSPQMLSFRCPVAYPIAPPRQAGANDQMLVTGGEHASCVSLTALDAGKEG